MIESGQKVKIKKLSKESYLLYKQYKNQSPLMVCPCHLEDKVLEVSAVIDHNIILLTFNNAITITYLKDLITIETAHHQTP